MVAGLLILLICSLIQHVHSPMEGEYYYSSFFRNNYTLLAKALFFIAGFLAGYFYRLNPWYTGLSLCMVFFVTSIIEATIYKGSHNLIPFEFAIYFILALPVVVAVYIGKFTRKQMVKQKEKADKRLMDEQ
jgi:peptidoglycan/LPS O-acetylase OafA/YrhL